MVLIYLLTSLKLGVMVLNTWFRISIIYLQAREFANELRASTKASRNPTVWLEASTGSGQNVNAADTSTVSEAYAKMLTIFIPLLVDEVRVLILYTCFEIQTILV